MQIPNLREWRERRALTQEELADEAGLSVRSVAGYEAGAGARPGTVRKLAAALDISVEDLLGKGGAPPSLQPTLNGVLEEQRRTLDMELLATYASLTADKMKEEIDAGHVTPQWGRTFYRQMTGMSMVFTEMMKLLPDPISEREKQGLARVSQALDKFDEVAQKLDKILQTPIPEREREELKAAFRLIQGELSA